MRIGHGLVTGACTLIKSKTNVMSRGKDNI